MRTGIKRTAAPSRRAPRAASRQTRGRSVRSGGLQADLGRLRAGADGFISSTFRGQSQEFRFLLAITLALVAIGLVMVLDASYVTDLTSGVSPFATFQRQAMIAVLGLLGMAVFSRISHDTYVRITPAFTLTMLAIQLATFFVGVSVNGNKSWIRIPFVGQFQPSEILKVALVLNLALLLEQRKHQLDQPGFRYTWWPALSVSALGLFLVGIGKDMGTVMIMAIFILVMLTMAGLHRVYLTRMLILGAIAAFFGTYLSGSRWARTIAWLNPNAPDPNDINWQSKHGVWALAAGGWTGVGFGKSTLKWSWIPEVDNDYIFAVIGEEFGLVGAAVVIGLFVALAFVMFRILARTQEFWARLAVGGVMAWITFQAMVNIAVVLSLLPVLGVPLPMISSGGSSLIANLLAIGIVLSIERHNSGNAINVRRRPRGRR